jgi:uncharacterized membrane protein
MKPLIVLLVSFAVSLIAVRALRGSFDHLLAGRIAMAAMLLFTSVAHFAFTKGLTMMMPEAIPYKTQLVYATGIIEITAALALLISAPLARLSGWVLIVFFVALLPANIHAALRHIDYEKANFGGHGPSYLWFRVPLQLFFIGWTYFFTIR